MEISYEEIVASLKNKIAELVVTQSVLELQAEKLTQQAAALTDQVRFLTAKQDKPPTEE